jgi:hypothetical protein
LAQYKNLPHQDINKVGFSCFSQFEEDGIVLYIYSKIGFESKKVVEISCGTGLECMSTNLIVHHGFKGFLFDGNKENIKTALTFFKKFNDIKIPFLASSWITKENINKLLENSGVTGEVDLLSIDIDGNDYYIWKEIQVINTRLVLIETHNVIPTNLSLTIPYLENFNYKNLNGTSREYRSASLAAIIKLGKEKGYSLIASNRLGFNAFLLRNDLLDKNFEEITATQMHDNEYTRKRQELWPLISNYTWVQV